MYGLLQYNKSQQLPKPVLGSGDAEYLEWILKALKDHKMLDRKQINELLWNK